MRVNEAIALAKGFVRDTFPGETVSDLRGEGFVFDDHLAVWTVTVAFSRAENAEQRVVRISNVDKSLLSIRDR
jgi:hypothetical protein